MCSRTGSASANELSKPYSLVLRSYARLAALQASHLQPPT